MYKRKDMKKIVPFIAIVKELKFSSIHLPAYVFCISAIVFYDLLFHFIAYFNSFGFLFSIEEKGIKMK